MKIIACYDNGGETFDRYTVVIDSYLDDDRYECLGIGYDPQGFSQWTTCMMGKHLGKKLKFKDLPERIQAHVKCRIREV